MAERKPLFMSSTGVHEEQATSDSITLGGLTMGGNVDLNSAGKITGCNAATTAGDVLVYGQTGANVVNMTITGSVTNDSHIATKSYVDTSAITGGSVKEAVLHASSQLSNTQGIRAVVALTLQNNAANDDRIVLTDGTTTRTYYFGTGSGDVQVAIGGSADVSAQNLANAITGDGSAIWGASLGVAYWESIDTDHVVVIYEDTTSQAVSKIYGTNWDAGDCQIVDFGGESDYTKQTLTDIPSSAPGSTNFGFRRTKANLTNGELHVSLGEDIIYSWDADYNSGAGMWQTYSGAGAIVDATGASGGGTKGKASFDSDKGLSVSSGVAAINLHATPGLEFNSGGVRVKIADTDELTRDANGLNVAGVDSAFKINGVATDGTKVNANNLQVLTVGGNADSLHVHTATSVSINHSDVSSVGTDDHHAKAHAITSSSDHSESGLTVGHVLTATSTTTFAWQAPQEAPAAQKVENTFTTATDATSDGDPIYWNGNNTIGKSTASVDAKARIAGIIRTGSGAAGATPEVVTHGPCAGILSGATANTPYYLGDSGGLSTSLPSAGNRVMLVGYALNATDLFIKIEDYGKRAA